jgi:hypothetical protein
MPSLPADSPQMRKPADSIGDIFHEDFPPRLRA